MKVKTSGRYVSVKEREGILNKLTNAGKLDLVRVVTALFQTGIRIGEYREYAKLSNAADFGGTVKLKPQKGNNERIIPKFSAELPDVSPESVKKDLQRWGFKCGFDLSPHDCRHTFLTNAAKECPNPFALMALSGHKDVKSLLKYVHQAEIENLSLYEYAYNPRHYDSNRDYYKLYKELQARYDFISKKIL